MKTAIVHDWLVTYSGAERVLEEIIRLFPDADLFSLIDFIPPGKRDFILNKPVKTSFLQKFPMARKKYRSFLPFMPLAIEQFDMSGYDLIISSSFAVAKGVITGPNQLHICMCYSPIRYAWDLTHHYLREGGLATGLKGWLAKYILHRIRMWDYRTANGVDEFIAISDFIAGRIMKVYRRDSTVIYPPVDTEGYQLCFEKGDYYLMAGRMVPYKNTELVVEAFAQMPDKKLVVIGDGPEFANVKRKAGPNVTLMGFQPYEVLKEHMQKARALIFAAEEDFGIVPIEAQSCGTPVIAYGRGGALETIIDGRTGLFFPELTVGAIVNCMNNFEIKRNGFDPVELRENALKFSKDRFRNELESFMEQTISRYFSHRRSANGRPVSLTLRNSGEVKRIPALSLEEVKDLPERKVEEFSRN